MSILLSLLTELLKKILVDKSFIELFADQSGVRALPAGWFRADQMLLHFYEKKLDQNGIMHYTVVVFFKLDRFFSSGSNVHGTNM